MTPYELAKRANEQLTISIETFPGTVGCTAFDRLCTAKALIEAVCYTLENLERTEEASA